MGSSLLGTSIASVTLHVAAFAEVPPATLYALLQLRVQVFIVEQRCPYQDLDGRDTDPGTRHVWLADGEVPLAYLRILAEPDGTSSRTCRRARDARRSRIRSTMRCSSSASNARIHS